ncbi:MAG: hypothetical protein RBS33_14030 [Lentimicrobium sp.]|jgi:hypothetical protein|nr:hypothetical protein [Lentimicrobium sp.]
MILKTIVIAILLLGFILAAFVIKLIMGKSKEVKLHTCAFEEGADGKLRDCDKCDLKDLTTCPEKNEA